MPIGDLKIIVIACLTCSNRNLMVVLPGPDVFVSVSVGGMLTLSKRDHFDIIFDLFI